MERKRGPPKQYSSTKTTSGSHNSRKEIKREPSVAQSESSGYSHLAGDVDRWIHGSGTNVSTRVRRTQNSFTSRGVQGSQYSSLQRRSTMVSGININEGPCYALAMMLLRIQGNGGPYPLAYVAYHSVLACAKFLVSQVKQACVDCLHDLHGVLQLDSIFASLDLLSTYLFAATMDVLFIVYAFGFLAIYLYQTSMGIN